MEGEGEGGGCGRGEGCIVWVAKCAVVMGFWLESGIGGRRTCDKSEGGRGR